MKSNHKIIEAACNAIGKGSLADAREIITQHYPFMLLEKAGRQYSKYQKTQIFLRDGFIDRYSGDKMIFPPVLRLLSQLMPEEFPFHQNWKMSECHFAFWELLPTIDHIVPVTRGGLDEESNWVCTSQLRNSAKSNWLLEELGWHLYELGNLQEWDGLLQWFMTYIQDNPDKLSDKYTRSWYKAAEKAKNTNNIT